MENSIYDYSFLCTYQHMKNKETSNLCYQVQFLQAFQMAEYESEQIENVTTSLYEELKDDFSFITLVSKLKNTMEKNINCIGFFNGTEEKSLKNSDIFCFVFCYEYFYKFHREYSLYKNKKNYNFDFII
tara:strand:- start:3060 stop:3446 length:387 start_codon:yes stop_codon:yes gene_type:complete